MIEITLDSMFQLLEEIVSENGEDFMYTPESHLDTDSFSRQCYYVNDDGVREGVNPFGFVNLKDMINPRPGCIVGHFLNRLGVSLEILHGHEGRSARTLLDYLEEDGILKSKEGCRRILRIIQSHQDSGSTWGEALKMGRKAEITLDY